MCTLYIIPPWMYVPVIGAIETRRARAASETNMPRRATWTEVVAWKDSVDAIAVDAVTDEVNFLEVGNESDAKRSIVLACVDHPDTCSVEMFEVGI